MIVRIERFAGFIATRFHAEKDHTLAIRKERPRLPGHLIRQVEIKVVQLGAVCMDDRRAALRREEKPMLSRVRSPGALRRFPASRQPSHRARGDTLLEKVTTVQFLLHGRFTVSMHTAAFVKG